MPSKPYHDLSLFRQTWLDELTTQLTSSLRRTLFDPTIAPLNNTSPILSLPRELVL